MSAQKSASNSQVIVFMVGLCVVCAFILAFLASALAKPQTEAEDLYRSKQLLIAASILDPQGFFLMEQGGQYLPATWEKDQLVLSEEKVLASSSDIVHLYNQKISPFLVNDQGEAKTFQELNIQQDQYLKAHQKKGFYNLPWKLIYGVKGTSEKSLHVNQMEAFVIPVSGFGLWDAIYGYLGVGKDGNHVLAISWYEQKETPGLGANISNPQWQSQFRGKVIFQPNASGQTNFQRAPLGLTVVRGKVSEVYGNAPKSANAVDGMSGATLTGNGVTQSYQECLGPYRPFFLKLHQLAEQQEQTGGFHE